jgi:PD-(D/E)XK nuclease superfamily
VNVAYVESLLIDGKIIVESKAVKAIAHEHQARNINYLKATGIEVRLQINFRNPNSNTNHSPDANDSVVGNDELVLIGENLRPLRFIPNIV